MFDPRLARIVVSIGSFATALSVGWWWLIFSKVVDNDYLSHGQAAICLAGATDLCTLAQALCSNQHLFGIVWYAPEAFWAGIAVLLAGMVMTIRRFLADPH